MKNTLRRILSAIGLILVLTFCVSATVAVADTQIIADFTLSEPLNMLLIGFGLIGIGTFVKSKFSRYAQ